MECANNITGAFPVAPARPKSRPEGLRYEWRALCLVYGVRFGI